MAIVPKLSFFSWNEIEPLGDLERLQLMLIAMPDEKLLARIHAYRSRRGRNDHLGRSVWNSLLARVVFQYMSIESLRRELERTFNYANFVV